MLGFVSKYVSCECYIFWQRCSQDLRCQCSKLLGLEDDNILGPHVLGDCKFLIKIRHASLPNKQFFDNIFGGFASLDYVKLCGSDLQRRTFWYDFRDV